MKLSLALLILLSYLSGCKYREASSMALAKEMCSCLFVADQSIGFCKEVTKESRILAKFKVNWNEKQVEARGLGKSAVGRLNDDPRFGCQIYSVGNTKKSFEHNSY